MTGEWRWSRVVWVVLVGVALSSAAVAQQGGQSASGQSQVQVTVEVQLVAPHAAPGSSVDQALEERKAAGFRALRRLGLVRTEGREETASRPIARSFALGRDAVRASVNTSLGAGELVAEGMRPNGSYEVVIRFTAPALGAAPAEAPGESAQVSADSLAPGPAGPGYLPAMALALRGDEPAAAPAPAQVGPFTGLIVDCRGLGIVSAMSPKILDSSGKEVWGTVEIDPDVAIERGIVGYYHSLEQARASTRAGENPLLVKAVGRFGGRAPYGPNPVVGVEDGARIVEENGRTKFLDTLHVCFVID